MAKAMRSSLLQCIPCLINICSLAAAQFLISSEQAGLPPASLIEIDIDSKVFLEILRACDVSLPMHPPMYPF